MSHILSLLFSVILQKRMTMRYSLNLRNGKKKKFYRVNTKRASIIILVFCSFSVNKIGRISVDFLDKTITFFRHTLLRVEPLYKSNTSQSVLRLFFRDTHVNSRFQINKQNNYFRRNIFKTFSNHSIGPPVQLYRISYYKSKRITRFRTN